MVQCPSVCPSVCPIRLLQQHAAALLLWAPWAGDIDGLLHSSWWRGTVVERRPLAGELSLSCARPAADG